MLGKGNGGKSMNVRRKRNLTMMLSLSMVAEMRRRICFGGTYDDKTSTKNLPGQAVNGLLRGLHKEETACGSTR